MRVGIVLTIIWIIGLICLIWLNRAEAGKLGLNEWGDFLAGAFAPLAFFWLVLGYLQQGRELKLSTLALKQQEKALILQVAELKDSVQQQKALVEATKEDIAINKEALNRQFMRERAADQPMPEVRLSRKYFYTESRVFEFHIYNAGKAASHIRVTAPNVNYNVESGLKHNGSRWVDDNCIIIKLDVPGDAVQTDGDKIVITVGYLDHLGGKEALDLCFEWCGGVIVHKEADALA